MAHRHDAAAARAAPPPAVNPPRPGGVVSDGAGSGRRIRPAGVGCCVPGAGDGGTTVDAEDAERTPARLTRRRAARLIGGADAR